MLETPFGKLRILADGRSAAYEAVPHHFDRPPVLDAPIAGCFRIAVPAERAAVICCVVETADPDIRFEGSSGEGYLAAECARNDLILTIGMEDDHPSFTPEVIRNGIRCTVHEPLSCVIFGVAWADDYQGASDVRTWYAADPTLDK